MFTSRREVNNIALYHFHVDRVKRSAGQSVVASAAYRSGENLHSSYYGEDCDYTRKGGVKFTEILLPAHAPPDYADRETLWNAVEKIEKHPKAQLAYSFDIALQNELTEEENKELAQQFCRENFRDHGMIVDLAIHDPDKDGGIQNPHFHVLCPMRPLTDNGEWDAKQHRVYTLDEGGNRIRDADGNYIFTSENTTDWDDPDTLRRWREAWAKLVNAKFAEKGLDRCIDHRTLEEQGIDALPTIHEGHTVRAMEAKGIPTEIGGYNRMIKSLNSFTKKLKAAIAKLCEKIAELKAQPQQPTFVTALGAYYQVRNEYATQNFGGGATKAKVGNLKKLSAELNYLTERGISTVAELEQYSDKASAQNSALATAIRAKTSRIQELNDLLRHAGNYKKYKPLLDELNAIRFKGKREKFQAEHDNELTQFYMAKRILKDKFPTGSFKTADWRTEIDSLVSSCENDKQQQKTAYDEMKKLTEIVFHVREGQRKLTADRSVNRRHAHEL